LLIIIFFLNYHFGVIEHFSIFLIFCFIFNSLVKNRNFGQKSKFWSKIDILVKSRNFGQKSTFWSKVEILVKNRNFGQKSKLTFLCYWIFFNIFNFLLHFVFLLKSCSLYIFTNICFKFIFFQYLKFWIEEKYFRVRCILIFGLMQTWNKKKRRRQTYLARNIWA